MSKALVSVDEVKNALKLTTLETCLRINNGVCFFDS